MALLAISDLHLSLSTDKPMDVFSGNWEGYMKKLRDNWLYTVKPVDTVIIPGDISWATYLEKAREDFTFINSLPGRKIISKGNHDYWWTTAAKMNRFIEENQFDNIFFLHNNYYIYEDWVICGTRGWPVYENGQDQEDVKIFNREMKRLELSLEQGKASGKEKVVAALHYPPFGSKYEYGFIEVMKKYRVDICLYGHLHGDFSMGGQGLIDGIEFKLVSSDYLDFKPAEIL